MVKEFYANAFKEDKDRKIPRKSFVKTKLVSFDGATINQMLGTSLDLPEEVISTYFEWKSSDIGIDNFEVAARISILGGKVSSNHARVAKRFIRSDLTTSLKSSISRMSHPSLRFGLVPRPCNNNKEILNNHKDAF